MSTKSIRILGSRPTTRASTTVKRSSGNLMSRSAKTGRLVAGSFGKGARSTPTAVVRELRPVPPRALARQAELLRARMTEVGEEFGLLTSADVTALSGRQVNNPSAGPTRWQRKGKVVAIPSAGHNLYPGFQFEPLTGSPRPVMARLIEVWGDDPVGLTLWCTAPNAWLAEDARPVDLFELDEDAVVDAARRAVEA